MAQVLGITLSSDCILKQSRDYLSSIDLHKLKKYGISRDKFDYELVYFYPPQRSLEPISTSDVFDDNLNSPLSRKNIGMYVHIPFCTGRCSYCHYISFTTPIPKVVEKYIEQLRRELLLLSNIPSLNKVRLTNLHIGGGTPTFLENKCISDLMSFIREHFEITNNTEITSESSPETIMGHHVGKLETLLENGVNRLNIGIQTFEEHLLKICNRRHSAAQAEESIRLARKTGFTNINVDIIYGLPIQNMQDWQHTLEKIEELLPESVTVYHLRVHPNAEFAKLPKWRFPSEGICLLMQIYAYEKLKAIGYTQVQPCQFALSSRNKHRYIFDKWGKDMEFLGAGVSAYGYINNHIYVNHGRLNSYLGAIRSNGLPIYLGKELSKEQKMAKTVMLGLKVLPCGMKHKDFEKKFGITTMEVFGEILTRLQKLGLVEINPTSVKLTWKGILFADEVCTELYTEEEKVKLKKTNTKYGCYLRH